VVVVSSAAIDLEIRHAVSLNLAMTGIIVRDVIGDR
jgi:hypothetical protein